jgi:hypothetical protein
MDVTDSPFAAPAGAGVYGGGTGVGSDIASELLLLEEGLIFSYGFATVNKRHGSSRLITPELS